MEKKKVTKHAVGDVYFFLDEFLSEHKKENFKITGIEFSNLGAQGREPLFDISYGKTRDIFAYWKDKNKKCIVISAPEPGYEIKAPKKMSFFFGGEFSHHFKITHLDVTHLDVSSTTNFTGCFEKFGFGENNKEAIASKIVGLETWDISNGEKFAKMFEGAFPQNENILLDLSSWRFNQETRISFWSMFQHFGQQASKVILNVSDWNTTNVCSFAEMFKSFAPHAKIVELKGIEDWHLGAGSISLDYTFDGFAEESSCCLDLSKWSIGRAQKLKMENFSNGVFFRIKEPRWD